MIILSADTSSDRFSVAVSRDDVVMAEFKAVFPNRQSSDILPEIDRLLSANSLNINDIGLFCVGLGPGSFTGLRIGVTIMRTMALALNRPVTGVASIDAIACNVPACKERVCVIIDARQGKVYARLYTRKNGILGSSGRIMLLGIEECLDRIGSPVVFTGDGIKTYKDIILGAGYGRDNLVAESRWYPRAEQIGRLGLERMRNRGRDNVFTLAPLYIYPNGCQIRGKK
jgi:tRNA threonylcarbamoyladenosine biosynthesis protein TsaB